VTTDQIETHLQQILQITGTRLLFGGPVTESNDVPKCYGLFQPTAVLVPINAFLNPMNFKLLTREIFGPFQLVVEYDDQSLFQVLKTINLMPHHLTAGIVSNDPKFINRLVSQTITGTTYVGLKARTTGAPQNHWFGPGCNVKGASLGTPEAIKHVWSYHREVVSDFGSAT